MGDGHKNAVRGNKDSKGGDRRGNNSTRISPSKQGAMVVNGGKDRRTIKR